MKDTDEQLLRAIARYREEAGGRHGPPSLDALAGYLQDKGIVKDRLSKGTLSMRIRRLVDAEALTATAGPDGAIQTFSLEASAGV